MNNYRKIIIDNKPVIHCITNSVTMNDMANIVLALGASPIMAHHKCEVAEVASNAGALVVNLGATDDYEAIKIAVAAANKAGVPVVLDPVGVMASQYRREFVVSLLKDLHVDCIRANYAEVCMIADLLGRSDDRGRYDESGQCVGLSKCHDVNQENLAGQVRGLDTDKKDLDDEALSVLQDFAGEYKLAIVASGPVDYIISEDKISKVESGDKLMKYVTGMGCMYTAVCAAFMYAAGKSLAGESLVHAALLEAASLYGQCGRIAGENTRNNQKGTMSFRNNFIDEISNGLIY